MKSATIFSAYILFIGVLSLCLYSCHKEQTPVPPSNYPPTEPNHPPVARAGIDQSVVLPNTFFNDGIYVNIDGRASTDPDNNVTNYLWTKISGPSSFINIVNPDAAQSKVYIPEHGIYQFELKVTDAGGLYSKDTLAIRVDASKEIIGELIWDEDPINKLVHTQTLILPNGYSVNEIKNAYLYTVPFFVSSFWMEIEKDGNNINEIYYKIDKNNNSVIAYWYFDTEPDYVTLTFAPYKIKIIFS